MTRRRSLSERFFENVIPEPNSGCWLWLGALDGRGYGAISEGGREGKNLRAHRVSLLLSGVDVPSASVVLHLCDNRICVNPEHLRVGTQMDNMYDMIAKGRHSHGDEHAARLVGKSGPKNPRCGASHPRWGMRKSVCKSGHPMTEENVFYESDGHRRCRACHRARALAAYHAKRDKAGRLGIKKL